MTTNTKQTILRANAAYLGFAALTAFLFMDLRGVYFGTGPVGRLLGTAPHSAIGFVEAHGLAFVLAIVLWRAPSERFWHLIAAGAELLLGTANLVFWQLFVDGDALVMGYVTTALHWVFVALQLRAAVDAPAGVRLSPAFLPRADVREAQRDRQHR
jgi:hypothetical protein